MYRPPRTRDRMSPLMAKALVAAGIVGTTVGLSYVSKRARTRREPSKEPPLEGVYSEGSRLPERIINDVMLPVQLSFAPRVAELQGDVVEGSSSITTKPELMNIVTDLTHERANIAYEYLLFLVKDEELDLSDPVTRDEIVQRTVSTIAPRVDWTQGLVYAFNSPEGLVWRGVQTLAEIAHQSYWNKQAATA